MEYDGQFPYKSTLFQYSSLRCFADRKPHRERDVVNFNLKYFNISDEEKELRTAVGKKPIHYTHSTFAFNELKNTPLLEKMDSGLYIISDKGLNFLNKYDGETEILPYLFKFLKFRCYKYANKNPEKLIFDSHFHIIAITSLDDLSYENDVYTYKMDKTEIVEKGNILLGYDKKHEKFMYLFEVIDIKDNLLFVKKNIELSSGYYLEDSKLSEYLNNVNFCSIYDDEFFELYGYFLNSIPSYEYSYGKNYEHYNKFKRNLIYFGAPGTGKSSKLDLDKEKLLGVYSDNYERVTFHPDYSYANFVGTYKPVPKYLNEESETISYDYVPGPFMRILKKAIKNKNKPYLLIIEEINRANVAAVFGDVFQLLDRNEGNISKFPIDATEDMKTYLERNGISNFKLQIPANMFIWATMNSADQGVFLMDTAFKRRWNFKYFSINHNEYLIKNTRVIVDNKLLKWNNLRKRINEELLSYNINEDKLIGPFFTFNEYLNEEISLDIFKDIFKNKIIMYLFEDAARHKRNQLFRGACSIKNKNNITYFDLCELIDKNKITEIFDDNFLDYEEI